MPKTKFNVFRANYARSCHEAAFMFIQTVSVVERNFIPRERGGGETIIKSKLARKRRTRMGQGVATPPRRVSDDTRGEEGDERSFGIRGA